MSLSTIDDDGYPVSRIVLMRGLSSQGLTFFTNYKSAKGRHLEARPKAEVQFFWRHLERQVRVRGVVKKISAEESDHYFASRPRDSQIGAWASPQSQVIRSRDELEDLFRTFSAKFADLEAVPRPPHWGGFRLEATDVEFWQGRSNRLHDRLCARRVGQDWHWQRLAP
jgi:pyridoxamine 5'-phosphate oxidase